MQTVSYDALTVKAAELRLDAEQGADLLAKMARRWRAEGRAAFWAGVPVAALWNPEQRQGYADAKAVAA